MVVSSEVLLLLTVAVPEPAPEATAPTGAAEVEEEKELTLAVWFGVFPAWEVILLFRLVVVVVSIIFDALFSTWFFLFL